MEMNQAPIRDTYQALHKIDEKINIKSCPKCSSVFLSDTECESCGFQLSYDGIGQAFGERSSFYHKEAYIQDLSLFENYLPHRLLCMRKKTTKYKRFLLKRFADLCERYGTNLNKEKEDHLFLECRHIISDYTLYGGEAKELYFLAQSHNASSLMSAISSLSQDKSKKAVTLEGPLLFWFRLLFCLSILCLSAYITLSFFLS